MTPTRTTQDRKRGRAGARPFVVFAALAAVLIQAFVIQTHTHAAAAPFGTAALERSADHGGPGEAHLSVAHEQGGCITCAAFAASGRALSPPVATLIAAHGQDYQTAALAIRRAPRAVAHSWQSRAPPIAL